MVKEIDPTVITADQKKLLKSLDKLSAAAYKAALAILQDENADVKIRADLVSKVMTLYADTLDKKAKNELTCAITSIRAELQEKQLARIGMKDIRPADDEDSGKPRVTFSPSVIQNVDGEEATTGEGILEVDTLKMV